MKQYINNMPLSEVIQRLKNGEVIKRDDGLCCFYEEQGYIVQADNDGNVFLGASIPVHCDDCFFEESFEIKETGVYKTKDGRKAYVYEINDGTDIKYPINYIIESSAYSITATKNGRHSVLKETKNDIISKWED